MSEKPEKDHTCEAFMRDAANARTNPMHGLPGVMEVSEYGPTVTAPEFPPQVYRCPHGTRFYAYPSADRIAALRALNGVN